MEGALGINEIQTDVGENSLTVLYYWEEQEPYVTCPGNPGKYKNIMKQA